VNLVVALAFAPGELGFGLLELAQALLPIALEAARNETVLGIDSAIAAFGTVPRTGYARRRAGTGRNPGPLGVVLSSWPTKRGRCASRVGV
jgi:hypothetical protein